MPDLGSGGPEVIPLVIFSKLAHLFRAHVCSADFKVQNGAHVLLVRRSIIQLNTHRKSNAVDTHVTAFDFRTRAEKQINKCSGYTKVHAQKTLRVAQQRHHNNGSGGF